MKQWLRDQHRADKKQAMPILSFPGIQLLGCTVQELVSDANLQAQCMKQIADRYPSSAAVSIMDLSLEAEAFGASVSFSDDEVPTVIGRLIDSHEDAQALKVPQAGERRTGQAVKGIQLAVEKITDRPVFAGIIGPYSLAGRLMEMTEIMIKCMIEPDTVHLVLEKVTDFLVQYAQAFKKAGAGGLVLAEPAAGLLSPDLCRKFSSSYVRQILEEVEDENFLVIYHNCGNTAALTGAILDTGARAIHLGNAVTMKEEINKYPDDILLMGNIDPTSVLKSGTPSMVQEACNGLLQALSSHHNWVLSSGCDIPPTTPLENIDAFFESLE